jgi:teichuronic acid biosynthesis glycosyltransferase TuaC
VKVLVVSHLYPSPGVERHLFVHEQARALKELGVESQVLSPTPYAPRWLWWDAKQKRRGQKPARAERDGIVAWYPRFVQPPRRLLFERLGDLAYLNVRRRLPALRAAGFDLIHAHQALPDGVLAQRLSRDLGIPYVVTVHGADVYQHLRQHGAVARRTAAILGGAAAVMANSSAVAGLLASVVPAQRLHVVLNGTTGLGKAVEPAADFLPGEDVVLTVGFIIARKGHATLLEALGLLAQRGLRPHWAIVGEGPLRASLEARAEALGVAPQLHFLGRQPHERVLALMKRAQLFALPSWDEAFGLVYTEAMAQGTPTLAGAGEGPEDFIESGTSGYLVPVRDAGALAAIIGEVLEHPDTAAAVGEAGRAAAALLTWERNAGLTLAVYREVAGATREDAR